MKKMLLVGMLVVSGLSFGRDFEYREYNEFQNVQNPVMESQEQLSREREISLENQVKYSDFMNELDNMDKGKNTNR